MQHVSRELVTVIGREREGTELCTHVWVLATGEGNSTGFNPWWRAVKINVGLPVFESVNPAASQLEKVNYKNYTQKHCIPSFLACKVQLFSSTLTPMSGIQYRCQNLAQWAEQKHSLIIIRIIMISFLVLRHYDRLGPLFCVSVAACCQRNEGVSSLTITCCWRSQVNTLSSVNSLSGWRMAFFLSLRSCL